MNTQDLALKGGASEAHTQHCYPERPSSAQLQLSTGSLAPQHTLTSAFTSGLTAPSSPRVSRDPSPKYTIPVVVKGQS